MNSNKLITIDGSQGEGGGQIVRSSLALSLLTGKPFSIVKIRAGRKKPGLALQHLTAVRAAARVGNAELTGDEIGSREITFRPNDFLGGHFEFPIQTAGSSTLVLQTILPPLMLASGESSVTITGGTHIMMAPPYDFIVKSYLSQVQKLGPRFNAELAAYGFYPVGGGKIKIGIQPASSLGRLEITERGKLLHRKATAIVSRLPRHIAEREIRKLQSRSGWQPKCFEIIEIEEPVGPGNVVLIELAYENVTEVFTGFGKQGLRAEQVADQAWRQVKKYLNSEWPIGEHLADQLMLPLGIGAHFGTGGGRFLTGPLSQHSKTHIDILKTFLDIRIDVVETETGVWVSLCPLEL